MKASTVFYEECIPMYFSTLNPLLTPILSSIILAANMQSRIKGMRRNQHGQKTTLCYSNLQQDISS